ncbi:hypothetical protein PHJA_001749900 [Phtheirospermum japonicum]|uniref:Uncharacterized protein n=1 Tax=Phtheirospermum japonicum TaxID=374723 RepID=A0A830CG83_9LAMI|nr:hypothetical protein PHJA_001749900 [Phtheirospermum japonicum]
MGASLPPKESNLFNLIAVSKSQSVPNKFNGDRQALGTFAEIGFQFSAVVRMGASLPPKESNLFKLIVVREISHRQGLSKHQNKFAWKPHGGQKINPTIDWKQKYGNISPFWNLPNGCAKDNNVCAKCSCQVNHIIGRDLSEVEAEQKTLEEMIMESIPVNDEVGGAYSYNALKTLDDVWSSICSSSPVVEEPRKVVSNVPSLFSESEQAKKCNDIFDVLVWGGTLGVFIATALSCKGLRVEIVEKSVLRGRGPFKFERVDDGYSQSGQRSSALEMVTI